MLIPRDSSSDASLFEALSLEERDSIIDRKDKVDEEENDTVRHPYIH